MDDDRPEITKYCLLCQQKVPSAQIIQRTQGHYTIFCDDCMEKGLEFKNTVQYLEIDMVNRKKTFSANKIQSQTIDAPTLPLWSRIVRCFKRVFSCAS